MGIMIDDGVAVGFLQATSHDSRILIFNISGIISEICRAVGAEYVIITQLTGE